MKYNNGPEFAIYNKLWDIWPDIDLDNTELTLLDIPADEKKKLLDFFDEILDKKDEDNEIL